MEKQYKILANCTVVKLREYSKSYGAPCTVNYAFIKEYDNEIYCFNSKGDHQRTFKKGTKILRSFEGQEISERTLKLRISKNTKKYLEELAKKEQEQKDNLTAIRNKVEAQSKAWREFLLKNPEKAKAYVEKINTSPSNSARSGNWRDYLKLQFSKHCNNESFKGIEITPPILRDLVFKIN